MGIPTYFRVITQQYVDIIKTKCPNICNQFFVDFNGLIHQAAYSVLDKVNGDSQISNKEIESLINEKTWDYLQNCITSANPSDITYTCIDGVAPVAKLSQQRKRRYLSVLHNKLSGIKQRWDRNAISPGTSFMINLESYMNKQFREKGTSCKLNYFSGSDEPGEGEHKLFAILNTIKKEDVAVIYGLDADLIMLSLISHHPKIYLMREPQHVQKELIASDDVSQIPFIYVDIHLLRVCLLKELAHTYKWYITDVVFNDPYCGEANDVIESYVTACVLLGNDFLPHIPSLSLKKNGHVRLLYAVKNAWDKTQNGNLVSSGKINAELLKEILIDLSKDEDKIIFKMNEEYLKKKPYVDASPSPSPSPSPSSQKEIDHVHCYAIQPQNKDPLAQYLYSSNCSAWRIYYYKHLFHCRLHDMITVNNACEQFIKGIYWVYCYYKRLPKDPKWVYPYNYSPTVLDLANYIQGTIEKWNHYEYKSKATVTHSSSSNPYVTKSPYAAVSIHNSNSNNSNSSSNSSNNRRIEHEFVSPVVQLLSILPPESIELLPRSAQKYMNDPAYGCMHLFPKSYQIQTYLKVHLWECTPVLPPLDVNLLEKLIDKKD